MLLARSSLTTLGGNTKHVAEVSAAITATMEEQGGATREIARNVQQAAQGTDEVTADTANVREGAGRTSTAAAQVLGTSREPTRHSADRTREVGAFLSRAKAARAGWPIRAGNARRGGDVGPREHAECRTGAHHERRR